MMKSLKWIFAAATLVAILSPVALPIAASYGQTPMNQSAPINVPVQAAWDAPTTVTLHAAQADEGGGIIHLSAFGWLAPYVDSVVQGLIALGFAILGKSKYSQWLDQSARDALETFLKNRASSLIADGAVKVENKTVKVDSQFLARAAAESATAIPGALKRFGLTPDAVAAKIIDAIPQTQAGATIVAAAHAEPVPKAS